MANEPFDPKTVSVEELAAYSRKVRLARWSGIVAGALLIWPAFWAATHLLPDSLDWAAIIIVILVPIGAFRLIFELLKPAGASING
jgi:drug/metabolite transporter (DMT)-like permease